MAADHRSILPNAAGFPWWGAVAVAVVATAVGVAFDAGSGDKELSFVFSALYVMGCLAAVLGVQQSGVFTAVIQPPLILFVAVPSAYWLLHGGGFPGLKAIVINCGYPLIERFPLMLFTAAAVLLIGMVRWYLGMLGHATKPATDDSSPRRPTLGDKLSAMLTAAVTRNPAHAIERPATKTRRERRPGERPRRATPEARRAARQTTSTRSAGRPAERRRQPNGSAAARSRYVPPDDAPVTDRPRRRRPSPDWQEDPMPRRRRAASEWQDEPPRRRRPAPADTPARRGNERVPRSGRDPRRYGPTEEPESLPRRRPQAPASGRGNGAGTTHHPISQVRYRRASAAEPGPEPRPRSRHPRGGEVDSWEYDI